MTPNLDTRTRSQQAPGASRLGERLRQLRVSVGLTQTELAGDRFSKEYVSQIERGKTRPTRETIAWLASQLGVDANFLANGVSADERGRLEGALARAEALLESGDNEAAKLDFERLLPGVRASGLDELTVRALSGLGTVQTRCGEVRAALDAFTEARSLAEGQSFSDVERAEILMLLGVTRLQLASVQTAIGLFNEALALAERSGMPCDLLRSRILAGAPRCWRHHRDYEAAREDVERALKPGRSAIWRSRNCRRRVLPCLDDRGSAGTLGLASATQSRPVPRTRRFPTSSTSAA